MNPPRLRMFAGPNGSGKSTIKTVVPEHLLGIYINPDEIESAFAKTGYLSFGAFGIKAEPTEIEEFLLHSPVMTSHSGTNPLEGLDCRDDAIHLKTRLANPYLASAISAFLREKLLARKSTFTFETVMSSVDKVELLCRALSLGYRTYLYFIATDDPEINIDRVRLRESLGGHNVPTDKIVSRYHKSLSLLLDAIRCSSRAYLFDNSGEEPQWIAEVTDGRSLELKATSAPSWFVKAVMNRI